MNLIKASLLLFVIAVLAATAFVYSGVYNIAADAPHWSVVFNLMETVRQTSIAAHAKDIPVPPLDDPKMIAEGAEHYSGMCTGCHLAPGMTDSEIRPGLYPQPPNLTQRILASPAEMFWTIKHGIKMSAMPAWGTTHDDAAIWGMVAFLQKLPELTPEQYAQLTGSAAKADEGHGHSHSHGEANDHAATPASDHTHADGDDDHADHDHAAPSEAPLVLDGLKPGALPAAETVANAFHAALQTGDRAGVLAVLAPQVTITEGGHTQSGDEYSGGHLAEDIAFLKTVQSKPISLGSMSMGDTAMVGSESEMRLTVKGQPKVIRSREMLSLKRENATWKIIAIRWQSSSADAH